MRVTDNRSRLPTANPPASSRTARRDQIRVEQHCNSLSTPPTINSARWPAGPECRTARDLRPCQLLGCTLRRARRDGLIGRRCSLPNSPNHWLLKTFNGELSFSCPIWATYRDFKWPLISYVILIAWYHSCCILDRESASYPRSNHPHGTLQMSANSSRLLHTIHALFSDSITGIKAKC